MTRKVDGKGLIVSLEFTAKAAEEFFSAYNNLKAEIEEIKPLSPYQIKKRKKDEWIKRVLIEVKQHFEQKIARDQDKIKKTIKAESLSWDEADYLLSELRSDHAKKSAQFRLKNAQAK